MLPSRCRLEQRFRAAQGPRPSPLQYGLQACATEEERPEAATGNMPNLTLLRPPALEERRAQDNR